MLTTFLTHLKLSVFVREVTVLIVLFAISVGNFGLYVAAEKRIDRAHELRFASFLLADELRQSSDDLTRMVRTYVATGNPLYKQHYQEILDIRNGVKLDPENYDQIYWDLVLNDDLRPRRDSKERHVLLDELRVTELSSAEHELLTQAKLRSDKLSQVEMLAMQAFESAGEADVAGQHHANLMLYDEKYHLAKAEIMRPIADFYHLMDERTKSAIEHALSVAFIFRCMMVVLILVLMFSLWRTYQALRATLGGSVVSVKNTIDKIAQGDFSQSSIIGVGSSRNNVQVWLTKLQGKLAESKKQQASLAEYLYREKERAQVTLSCIGDAVITTDAQGRVSFLNQVATDLTGWLLVDAHNRPVADIFKIVNETTRHTVLNPVDKVLQHRKTVVLENQTVLISRDGTEYNIEDSAAPILLENGELLGCVLVFRDVTEKHRLLSDVRWQAGHDVLTGLPNRALLADRFERALAAAQRQKNNLVVCVLDLDDFKPVNDLYGHAVGDQLLVQAAKRLTELVRAEDTVARMGGDEFVLLLSGLRDDEEADQLLQRIRSAMCVPYLVDGKNIIVSASIGAVSYPEDHADSDTLLRHADQAMYQAKQGGRNRHYFFDVHHDKEAQTIHQTLARVKQAIACNELNLYYQPKVNMRNGQVLGMEALLRWMHPQQGTLLPGAFLAALEQTDLIVDIGDWVLETALAQLHEWHQRGLIWSVSVNIAARHFQHPDFYARLKNLLARYPNMPEQSLQIEILESVAQHDVGQVRLLILQCQELGVSFALDDFGTGFSSLSYLKHLPAQTLKIDQSFVRDILDDQVDRAVVEAIIGLARVFNREVVAEGVESKEHGVLLMHLGCDVAQGYCISSPLPAEAVPAWCDQFSIDKSWALWSGLPWRLLDLPLLTAKRDHVAWVNNVIAAVEYPELQLLDSHLHDPTQCRFGVWYVGLGQQCYGHLPAFLAIKDIHQRVHETAIDILRLRNLGEITVAKSQSASLLRLKDLMLSQLSELQASVAQDGNA